MNQVTTAVSSPQLPYQQLASLRKLATGAITSLIPIPKSTQNRTSWRSRLDQKAHLEESKTERILFSLGATSVNSNFVLYDVDSSSPELLKTVNYCKTPAWDLSQLSISCQRGSWQKMSSSVVSSLSFSSEFASISISKIRLFPSIVRCPILWWP